MNDTKIPKLEKQLEEKHEELARLKKRQYKLRKQYSTVDLERHKIKQALHRENLKQLIGKQVKRRYRCSSDPQLNDAAGTLTAVRRTQCSIDFGEHGPWHFPIDDVIAADKEQGWTFDHMGIGGTL